MNFLFVDGLTQTDLLISTTIYQNCHKIENMSIVQVADLCHVSASKITKYSHKLGFDGFKELKYKIKESTITPPKLNMSLDNQIDIIKLFLDNLNRTVLYDFIDIIDKHESIYLHGSGASLRVAEYIDDRLAFASKKPVQVFSNEEFLYSSLQRKDSNPLVIILSASLQTADIENLIDHCFNNTKKVILITESIYKNSKADITINLIPNQYDYNFDVIRSRSIFLIYLEFVIQELLNK